MQKVLEARSVAYLNVDISVQGNYTFQAKAAPSLRDLIFDATKLVPNPDQTEIREKKLETVFDSWNAKTSKRKNLPK